MAGAKTTVLWGDNPTTLYLAGLFSLLQDGKEYAPRGKRIKELRPVVIEYHNPHKRVTFVKGRVINPLFQLAECFWIASGRSDVPWLLDYNKNMATFSDDGKFFNAPYGERLRHWGKNDYRNFIFNPIDQLKDCYEKLKADPDTRQAVAFIGNPQFDNSEYTLNGGKDIACNINIKFKIRDGKLDISVDNRSNDLHWGTFGANLAQFSFLQELMASWLGIEVGTYFQVTDSLHIYLDDYGAKETANILKALDFKEGDGNWKILPSDRECAINELFYYDNEPRLTCSFEDFEKYSSYFWQVLDPMLRSDAIYDTTVEEGYLWESTLQEINRCPDQYLRLTFLGMFVKQAHNRKCVPAVLDGLEMMPECSWMIATLRFLYPSYKEYSRFTEGYSHYPQPVKDYIERKDIV